jgi:glutamine synthetase adenylyltransferase
MNNFRNFINNDIEESVALPPKLHRLLRMGLSNKKDLETMRRALRTGHDKAMLSPRLRKQLSQLLNKFIDAVEDDNEIFRRMRNRIQKGKTQ